MTIDALAPQTRYIPAMAKTRKPINLALQGGGALGAFTWGVVDRLLEDDRIEIAAVSGASAGAMNAVVLCQGLASGGPEQARKCLRRFWEAVAEAGSGGPLNALMSAWMPPWGAHLQNPFTAWMSAWTSTLSPYDFNPLNVNPLRDLLEDLVDFDAVRGCQSVRLFISATNVRTGRVRVFTNPEIGADQVLASACLPLLFQAVEIDGEAFWDGGYMGNPPLFPLFETPSTRDILIVQLNPIERARVPHKASEITARINEITFNASLLRELHTIDFVARLVRENRVDLAHYREMLVHVISDADGLAPLGEGADLRVDLRFFETLFELGRKECEAWLAAHFTHLGKRSTVDLSAMFRGDVGPMIGEGVTRAAVKRSS